MRRWSERRQGRGGRRWRRGRGQRLRRPRGCVGAALVLLGRCWSYRATGAEARARARRRGRAGGRREWLGRRCRAAAAMHTRASGRENRMNWRGRGPSVKFSYVRRAPRRPSDISLCLTACLRAVGHKLMSNCLSASPRMSRIMSDGRQ
jgi:hypothetical protein